MHFRKSFLLPVLLLASGSAFASGVPQDDLQEYGKGIIADYGDMQAGEDIQWYWIAPGSALADHRCNVASVENLTVTVDHDMRDVFKEELPEVLGRVCSDDAAAAPLDIDVGIYWAERANTAKAWIPFVGGHLMQAGVGIEMVFRGADGQVVAKLRQSGREGGELRDSSRELVDDIARFVRGH